MTKDGRTSSPSLEHFELLVQSQDYEGSLSALLSILSFVRDREGVIDELASDASDALFIATRLCNAISQLFVDRQFSFSLETFFSLMHLQRWYGLVLGCTRTRHADASIHALCQPTPIDAMWHMREAELQKCLFLCTVESELALDFEVAWSAHPNLMASLFLSWLSTSMMASPAASRKREFLLAWWPARLAEATQLHLAYAALPPAYMLCSYGLLPQRHRIKPQINRIIRAVLLQKNLGDVVLSPPPTNSGSKPVLLVITEWFAPNFSVYRTHAKTIEAAKPFFHIVGLGPRGLVTLEAQSIFDEYHDIPIDDVIGTVAHVRELAHRIAPDIVYYPGVGMFPHTVFLSNIRLAPIQIVSNGHGASTYSPCIDYFLADESYISGQAAFSEALLPIPSNAMVQIANADLPAYFLTSKRLIKQRPDTVHIAVAAALLKINPALLTTLQSIADAAQLPVQFHFLVAGAKGLALYRLQQEIDAVLGSQATVYAEQAYADYLTIIATCDCFLNPFPYGNTNGIADMAVLGMPGICMAGPELAEHIDVGMFRRIGMPEWCVAWSEQDYIAAALRMIDGHDERNAIAEQLIQTQCYRKLYDSETSHVVGERLLALHVQRQSDNQKLNDHTS